MQRRLSLIQKHLSFTQAEVVICAAYRTPLLKARTSIFTEFTYQELLQPLINKIVQTLDINIDLIKEIVIGNVLGENEELLKLNSLRYESASIIVTNRYCASGLDAVAQLAQKISCGIIDSGIAGGVEIMSRINPNPLSIEDVTDKYNIEAKRVVNPTGQSSDFFTELYNLQPEELAQYSYKSHIKATKAIQEGRFIDEIVPIQTNESICDRDTGPIQNINQEKILKLKPAFTQNGKTTAGNSSQLTDGAALVFLTSKQNAIRLNLPILAIWKGYQVSGVPPELFPQGIVQSVPKVLSQVGISLQDVDLIEMNEAFASQSIYCIRRMGFDTSKVNVNGGAIALGHPLGCTGCRVLVTLIHEMKKRDLRYGLVTMCAQGMGASAVISKMG